MNLTEPVTNTRLYGESIARIANVLGDGKPIIQSLKDLRNGRRSEWHRLNKGFIEPTLKDCVAGDLALVMPHRIITNILEGLEILDRVGGGDSFASGLIYGLMTSGDAAKAIEYGTAHGALAMTTPGDTTMATCAEVKAIIDGVGARVKR